MRKSKMINIDLELILKRVRSLRLIIDSKIIGIINLNYCKNNELQFCF